MTAKDIQRALLWDRYRQSMVLPNYTPRKWWECDVFEITKAGYFREYEIKLSLSDFRADAAKAFTRFNWETRSHQPIRKKHDDMAAHSPLGPTAFHFVCPADLIPIGDIPPWAGLIYARQRVHSASPGNCLLDIIKPAPRLHNGKPDPKILQHARSICYWRYINLWLTNKTVPDNLELPLAETAA